MLTWLCPETNIRSAVTLETGLDVQNKNPQLKKKKKKPVVLSYGIFVCLLLPKPTYLIFASKMHVCKFKKVMGS